MRRPEAGFTLVEVLVAVVIVGLVGAATAQSFQVTTSLLSANQRHLDAAVLAQEEIENLRTIPYGQIKNAVRQSDDGKFVVTTEVLENTPDPGLKQITVTAAWNWKGEPRSYALHSVYSKLTRD
jgi:prepilin-type N-terminal cleavage/methylation domain-containing protein